MKTRKEKFMKEENYTLYVILFFFALAIALIIIVQNSSKSLEENEKRELDKIREDFIKSIESRGFFISKEICFHKLSIFADDTNKNWTLNFPPIGGMPLQPPIFSYSQLIEFEIKENGEQIVQGRAGSALLGGLFLGTAGAIAGASKTQKTKNFATLELCITVNDIDSNSYRIYLVQDAEISTYNGKQLYENAKTFAQQVVSLFSYIQRNEN